MQVIDDDDSFLLLATRALEVRGHKVETATTAFGIVNRIASGKPDVLVLDCDMPGLSGFAALELLAKDRRTSQVPVFLVSAVDTEQHRNAVEKHPVANFFVKSGRFGELADRIEEFMASPKVVGRLATEP